MKINVVWLKKDVRWKDHEVINYASALPEPILFVFFFEPSVMKAPESDVRHWRFMYQGLMDFNVKRGADTVLMLQGEALHSFEMLSGIYEINAVFSHQETGLEITYKRDQHVRKWCKSKGIIWKTFERDGIRRNVGDRVNWQANWDAYMKKAIHSIEPKALQIVDPDYTLFDASVNRIPEEIQAQHADFQIGGEARAIELLNSFTHNRSANYLRFLARPEESQNSCSRLSPYIAHGHISLRTVYQRTKAVEGNRQKEIAQFHNRLWWRCHYVQKLETEYEIENEHINRGFVKLKKPINQSFFDAWSTGNTGFPMIDASMRCLLKHGYLNFRMRAMLATFWSFTLWQDWRIGATHLAKVFLDFEPGIHYPQFQMQAGMTGYHPLRIFNPVVQAKKYDEEGIFIKKWIPELGNVPNNLVGTPWLLSPLEQNFYQVRIGIDYPAPIVEYDQATKRAKDLYWDYRNSDQVRSELPELWRKHSLPKDIVNYEKELKINKGLVTESIMYDPKDDL
ncbi:MAG: FAD-binding domain-containing protein [Bacteroidota bacterium]